MSEITTLPPEETRENEFVAIAYLKFFAIFEKIFSEEFWSEPPTVRMGAIAQGFAIYSELLNHAPIREYVRQAKTRRPPMEGELAEDVCRFIRNIFAHFPLFDCWNEIYINKNLVNWERGSGSIDRFLRKYQGQPCIRYRFWEAKTKKMTYLNVQFPSDYAEGANVYLKDILDEKSGVSFSFVLMRNVLKFQLYRPLNGKEDYAIMAAVGNTKQTQSI